jgi:hypothetical protein
MITSCAPWAQSWPKPNACKECVPGTQLKYRVCLTTIRRLFETTRHNGPDVSGTIFGQLLAGLDCAEMILSEVSAPTQHSVMYPKTQSEANVPSEELSVAPPFHEFATDDHSVSDGDSQVTENVRPSRQSRASHRSEGATSAEPTVTAGTSQRG